MELNVGQSITGGPMMLTGAPNWHMSLYGISGSGKTTEARKIILRLLEQSARIFIFDFTGDYLELGDKTDVEVLNMRDSNIALTMLDPEHPDDTPEDIADRVITLLQSRLKLGDSQWAYLSGLIASGLENQDIKTFEDIVRLVEYEEIHKNVAVRLLPKLCKVNRILPKGNDPATWKLDTPGITILDLHRISDSVSLSILVELLVGSICGRRMNQLPTDAPPVFLAIDECHRLKLSDGSYIGRLLREGRKYNLHGIFSTQWVKTHNEAALLEQTAAQFYFRMSDREAARTAESFPLKDRRMKERYRNLLANMARGQFLLKYNNRFYLSMPPRIPKQL